MRAAVVAVVAAALIPLSQVATAESASAQSPAHARQHPRSFTGYALDTCDAPSQRAMNRWLTHSRYWGIGIYIAGMNRACSSQPHLTRRWVQRQSANGWRLLPLVVGRQAACSPRGYYSGKRISSAPDNRYRHARKQGHAAANSAVSAAQRLGIGRRSVLWYDLEHFDLSRDRCRRSAMAFTSSWTRQLHDRGYRSGFYSSASSGIRMVDAARRTSGDGWATPDMLWIAEWNYRDNLRSAYISTRHWWPHGRVHQFRGGHTERHGGVPINIDSNYFSVGGGSRAGAQGSHCGTRMNFREYRTIVRGAEGAKVRIAQCLLRKKKAYDGRVHGRYTKALAKAVRTYQRAHHLRVSGKVDRRTWTVLLSSGRTPLLKFGSGSNAVRRMQRALNASSDARLRVDGVFARSDVVAVRGFQKEAGLVRTGVVAGPTWRRLTRGFVAGALPKPTARARALLRGVVEQVPFNSGATPR